MKVSRDRAVRRGAYDTDRDLAKSGAAGEKRVACDRLCGLVFSSFFHRFRGVSHGTRKNGFEIE
jgi:hypothetical protein